MYIKFPHLERLGHQETDEILNGEVFIFSKIDGTNGSCWLENGKIHCGSRNVNLKDDENPNDNQGFKNYLYSKEMQEKLLTFFSKHPNHTLFGEWMKPHSLKTYRPEAWDKFWIFDILNRETGRFIPYTNYADMLTELNLDFIPPMISINNPSEEQVKSYVEKNTFLIKDGEGLGEGVVIKNYSWRNQYGRQVWAKVVRNEFRELNQKVFGVPSITGSFQVEVAIAEKYVTQYLVNKTRAKIEEETKERRSLIPRLLNQTYYDIIREELWSALKEFNNPTINFKKLQQACFNQIKKNSEDLF